MGSSKSYSRKNFALKRHKTKDSKVDDGSEDWFAKLPDDVLVLIISFLEMKEAARTSVLSRRWIKLWTEYSGSLNFDDPAMILQLEQIKDQSGLDAVRPRFLTWVNRILEMHRGQNIDELRVRFSLELSHRHFIDNWLDFALARSVKRLDFDFDPLHDFVYDDDGDHYCLPDKYLESSLHLRNSPFSSLTSFSVKDCKITTEVIDMLLLNCPLLERLSVKYSRHLLKLKVMGPSLKLKHLEVIHCDPLEKLEVSAPRLVSLKYHGPADESHVENVPHLTEMSIGAFERGDIKSTFKSLSRYFSQLTILELKTDLSEVGYVRVNRFPVMSNLKQLQLYFITFADVSVLGWTVLFDKCPILQKFAFWLEYNGEQSRSKLETRKVAQRPYENVKELEFVGFVGVGMDTELGMFCLDNCPMVEKLVVDRRDPVFLDIPSLREEMKNEKVAAEQALVLQAKLPATAQFVLI